MKKVRVVVDYENGSEDFWQGEGGKLWAEVAGKFSADEVELTQAAADDLFQRASMLPGWSDGPEHARHPLIVVDAVEEE